MKIISKPRIKREGCWYIVKSDCGQFEEKYVVFSKAYDKAVRMFLYKKKLLGLQ